MSLVFKNLLDMEIYQLYMTDSQESGGITVKQNIFSVPCKSMQKVENSKQWPGIKMTMSNIQINGIDIQFTQVRRE